MADLFVAVGAEHIKTGDCKIPQRCMIAQAIKEHHPTVTYVSVRTNGITVTKRTRNGATVRQHWAVPTKAAKAIIAFDMGGKVKPFSFHAKLIDEVKIPSVTPERQARDATRTKARRDEQKTLGVKPREYGPRARIAGV